jgi:hypothetical protein
MSWLKKLLASIFATESSFRRPLAALSLAFTSNFFVLWSFFLAKSTRYFGLLLMSVFSHNWVNCVNGLMNGSSATIFLCWWFTCKSGVEVVWTELDGFVIRLANPSAVKSRSTETLESVQVINRETVF